MKTRIEISRGLTPISHVAKQLPVHLFFENPTCLSPSRFASVMREMATGRPSILLALSLEWLFPRSLSFDPHIARGHQTPLWKRCAICVVQPRVLQRLDSQPFDTPNGPHRYRRGRSCTKGCDTIFLERNNVKVRYPLV